MGFTGDGERILGEAAEGCALGEGLFRRQYGQRLKGQRLQLIQMVGKGAVIGERRVILLFRGIGVKIPGGYGLLGKMQVLSQIGLGGQKFQREPVGGLMERGECVIFLLCQGRVPADEGIGIFSRLVDEFLHRSKSFVSGGREERAWEAAADSRQIWDDICESMDDVPQQRAFCKAVSKEETLLTSWE